ncbi:class I SAM-dependent DNA methyltransferase [Bosea caraganae]|uniref:site-specific DNA-methyltransferase (adenine-specific) n=1 Tax=Bosea caraganae TaxID=2763117 RepID=A0A370L2E3_9HYPH|nr:DNA methyltransferase [Bosea caraganae]RDJ22120.1 class I SAM-dependent DNA methyltransferase [Bosea caraganae]RDJ22793.1 class I SAM-dependent DNA methyltransferase [Bosea caraganae]
MSGGGAGASSAEVEAFVARWRISEGAERAAYAQFLDEFCALLGVGGPQPPTSDPEAVTYRFEYPVKFHDAAGGSSTGRIDLYSKGCFVLEAKQSRLKGGSKEVLPAQGDLPLAEPAGPRGRRGADRAWDVLMLNARRQAEDYAKALPAAHGWPPFLIICDVGHCFEFYADFTGQGKNYVQFPDRQSYRVYLDDLHKPEIRQRIATIWTEPQTLDPTRYAARVTRGIAERLAAVSKALERQHDPEEVALFLMRCLFTMFAEDVALIRKDSFKTLLRECRDDPSSFLPLVSELWQAMDKGEYSTSVRERMKRFNGKLYEDARVFPLGREEIGELLAAAEHDWKEVEPAIFGTLLEQALDPTERARLGAHYTPRAYVERLVVETVIAPLREDWRAVLGAAQQARDTGDAKKALVLVEGFHAELCRTRVLDPACGTGNFLHVAQELMKKLEAEVLEAAGELGSRERLGGIADLYVGPHQFLGMDMNRRAVAIADLVLWIGHLQWHFRTRGLASREPILEKLDHIYKRDAVLCWDGWPIPQWLDGKEALPNPRRPDWPEAEFIVGNPPFMGGKDIRARQGDAYVEALRAAHPQMNESADLVMYWWDRAAELLTRTGTVLRRFGFVTTNSITQVFQRRVVERHLNAKKPVSLLLAIPDHPWTKAGRDTAAVRIAMTVVAAGRHEGRLREVVSEAALDTDQPEIELSERVGRISADLSVGADVTQAAGLLANEGLSSRGMMLFGAGFIVTEVEARALGLGRREGLEKYIRQYRNGRDLMAKPRGVMVIDLFGQSSEQVRERFPEVYQHVLRTVKIERDRNRDADIKKRWWLFGRTRDEIRPALVNLQRYIATVETAKHRVFQFLDRSILPDNMLVAVGLSDAFHLGVLSSRFHSTWALRAGGWLGIGNDPRYSKSRCFDPFPFPDATETQKQAIRKPTELLDALRKLVLDEHPDLTLTRLYNVREAIRAGRRLTPAEADIRDRGFVLILNEHHDAIDAAVATAYGWPVDLSDEDILARLVQLNRERAREEARGEVRWLRPDYQRPRFGRDGKGGEQVEAAELVVAAPVAAGRPSFPVAPVERVAAVLGALATSVAPLDEAQIALGFRQGLRIKGAVRGILISLARVGEVSTSDGGRSFSRRLRASG